MPPGTVVDVGGEVTGVEDVASGDEVGGTVCVTAGVVGVMVLAGRVEITANTVKCAAFAVTVFCAGSTLTVGSGSQVKVSVFHQAL